MNRINVIPLQPTAIRHLDKCDFFLPQSQFQYLGFFIYKMNNIIFYTGLYNPTRTN